MKIYKSEIGNIFTGKSGKIEKILKPNEITPSEKRYDGITIYRLINIGISVDTNYSRHLF